MHRMRKLVARGALGMLALAVTGCDSSSTPSDSGVRDSGAFDSGALDSGALDSGALDSGADGAIALSSGQILQTLLTANQAEIDAGNLALQRASKAAGSSVKSFAQQMITEHSAARQQLQALTSQITPTSSSVNQLFVNEEAHTSSLLSSAASGTNFDLVYMCSQVRAHSGLVQVISRDFGTVQNAQLATLVQAARTMATQHLGEAEQIIASLRTGAGSDGGIDGGFGSSDGGFGFADGGFGLDGGRDGSTGITDGGIGGSGAVNGATVAACASAGGTTFGSAGGTADGGTADGGGTSDGGASDGGTSDGAITRY